MAEKRVPTLYEWAGGAEKIETLFKRFYEHVRKDQMLAPVFAEMPEEHSQVVAHFVAEVLGGPKLYTGNPSNCHATMVAKHLNRHLTEAQRKHWMQLLLDTADELKLPDDPEFRSSLVAYLEWGSRIAVLNSTATTNPIDPTAPMPKWGWGETKGPYQPEAD